MNNNEVESVCPACAAVVQAPRSKFKKTRELIAEGRAKLSLSETAFAQALGVTRGSVQQWEKVGGTAPKLSRLPAVAHLLGMTAAQLINGGPRPPAKWMRRAIPIVSEVEAGGFSQIDNYSTSTQLETVLVTVDVKRHTFALRVRGNSMRCSGPHSFPEGTIVVVEPEMKAEPGDFVIVLDQAKRATFKQLMLIEGRLHLVPLNKRFKTIALGDLTIIGVVREAIRQLR